MKPSTVLSSLILFTLCITSVTMRGSPIESHHFEGFPPGARSLGLGNVGIALPNEPFANYYNPGAACFIQNTTIAVDFAEKERNTSRFPGIAGKTINYLSFISYSGGFTWRPLTQVRGQSTSSFFSDTYQETLTIESHHEYRVDELFLTLTTLSSEILNTLEQNPLFGLNLKYFRAYYAEAEVIHTSSSPVDAMSNFDTGNGFGVDAGFALVKNPFLFGLAAKDIFSKVYWSDYDSDRIDTKLGMGVSSFFFDRILLSTDYRYNTRTKISSLFAGIETNVYQLEKVLKENTGSQTERSLITSGSQIRFGTRLDDIEKRDDIIYSLGIGYFSTRFAADLAIFANFEDIKNKHFSTQLSLIVLY
jgi:hypothetical protein